MGPCPSTQRENMKKITLFIKDFKSSTKIAEKLVELNIDPSFSESIYDIPDKCIMAILDLDDKVFGSEEFILQLTSDAKILVIGYALKIRKDIRDKTINAGCKIILPKSSILKNFEMLLDELIK